MAADLDQIDVAATDPEGIINHIENFLTSAKTAWEETQGFELPDDYRDFDQIIIAGMGGSGIAAEIVAELTFKSKTPIAVSHNYDLPGSFNAKSLLLACSYSGNTEETLSAFNQAKQRGAKIIALATGGKLSEMASAENAPLFEINYVSPPRMSLAYQLFPLLSILAKVGVIEKADVGLVLDNVAKQTANFKIDVAKSENKAKQLAGFLQDKVPVFYPSVNLRAVGLRFKDQLNENAKNFGACDFIPELNHNAICGYDFPKSPLAVVSLESKFTHERNQLRHQITADILTKSNVALERVTFPESLNDLSEHLCFIILADYTSFYLAMLNGVDPARIDNIRYLKAELGRG